MIGRYLVFRSFSASWVSSSDENATAGTDDCGNDMGEEEGEEEGEECVDWHRRLYVAVKIWKGGRCR